MKKKRATIICTVLVLFFTLSNIYAQEKYLSQNDIDVFIANYDAMIDDDIFSNLNDIEFDQMPPIEAISKIVGKDKWLIDKKLQEYGITSHSPLKAFYTMTIGSALLQVEAVIEILMMMAEMTEGGEAEINEMLNSAEYIELFSIKDSIHPDDLLLLTENLDALGKLIMGDLDLF